MMPLSLIERKRCNNLFLPPSEKKSFCTHIRTGLMIILLLFKRNKKSLFDHVDLTNFFLLLSKNMVQYVHTNDLTNYLLFLSTQRKQFPLSTLTSQISCHVSKEEKILSVHDFFSLLLSKKIGTNNLTFFATISIKEKRFSLSMIFYFF